MRKAIAFILGILMVFSLSACGGSSNNSKDGHSYKYKYPTEVEHAVWWEMHENRIKKNHLLRSGKDINTSKLH